jgi:hypothetical protein
VHAGIILDGDSRGKKDRGNIGLHCPEAVYTGAKSQERIISIRMVVKGALLP